MEDEKDKKDILVEAGITSSVVRFFRDYQTRLKKGVWYEEKNGRFASSFRYYMLQGVEKNLKERDLLVAAAILFSHHGSYLDYLLNSQFGKNNRDFEIGDIKKTVRYLANYMSQFGFEIVGPYNPLQDRIKIILGFEEKEVVLPEIKIKLTPARYINFFCNLPVLWGR